MRRTTVSPLWRQSTAVAALIVSLLLCWVVSGIGSRMGLKSAAPNPAFYEKEAGAPAAVLR